MKFLCSLKDCVSMRFTLKAYNSFTDAFFDVLRKLKVLKEFTTLLINRPYFSLLFFLSKLSIQSNYWVTSLYYIILILELNIIIFMYG